MLAAIVGSLKDIIPDVAITVITGNCRMTRENHKVQAVHRLNFFAIAAAIRRCDILISGGGSLLQDVTSARSLYYYLWIMKIALFFKKPVMLYAQGIGPVRGIKAREAVQKVLQRVSVIGVRDRDSKAELMDMGVTRPPIHVTADASCPCIPSIRPSAFRFWSKRELPAAAGASALPSATGRAISL